MTCERENAIRARFVFGLICVAMEKSEKETIKIQCSTQLNNGNINVLHVVQREVVPHKLTQWTLPNILCRGTERLKRHQNRKRILLLEQRVFFFVDYISDGSFAMRWSTHSHISAKRKENKNNWIAIARVRARDLSYIVWLHRLRRRVNSRQRWKWEKKIIRELTAVN